MILVPFLDKANVCLEFTPLLYGVILCFTLLLHKANLVINLSPLLPDDNTLQTKFNRTKVTEPLIIIG